MKKIHKYLLVVFALFLAVASGFFFFLKRLPRTESKILVESAKEGVKKINEIRNLPAFLDSKDKTDKILVFEPNGCHQECIPGFAKYFIDLGYSVDVLLMEGTEDCFSIFSPMENVQIYTFNNQEELYKNSEILKNKFRDYYRLFLNTTFRMRDLEKKLCLYDLDNGIYVTHRYYHYKNDFAEKMKKCAVMLGEHLGGSYVNPHYFGDTHNHNKSYKTRFIVIGNMDSSLRNYDLLMKSVRKLKKADLNFTVTVVGRLSDESMIPKDVRSYFDFKGRVPYKELFNLVEDSDYILMLLDSSSPGHKKYKRDIVSGNIQLSYGFKKPVLIAEEFANVYRFNTANSLVYSKNDLAKAMIRAIKMSSSEYSNVRDNLGVTAKGIYEKSLSNLRKLL